MMGPGGRGPGGPGGGPGGFGGFGGRGMRPMGPPPPPGGMWGWGPRRGCGCCLFPFLGMLLGVGLLVSFVISIF